VGNSPVSVPYPHAIGKRLRSLHDLALSLPMREDGGSSKTCWSFPPLLPKQTPGPDATGSKSCRTGAPAVPHLPWRSSLRSVGDVVKMLPADPASRIISHDCQDGTNGKIVDGRGRLQAGEREAMCSARKWRE
jgi:hypothetical protein